MDPALTLTIATAVLTFAILVAVGGLTLKYSAWFIGNIRLPYVQALKLIIGPALCMIVAFHFVSYGSSVYGGALVVTFIVSWVIFAEYILDTKGVRVGNFIGFLIGLLNLFLLIILLVLFFLLDIAIRGG